MWDIDKLVAIDIHTHAHTPQEFADPEELKQREAMRKYFGQKGEELSMKQIADYYRELPRRPPFDQHPVGNPVQSLKMIGMKPQRFFEWLARALHALAARRLVEQCQAAHGQIDGIRIVRPLAQNTLALCIDERHVQRTSDALSYVVLDFCELRDLPVRSFRQNWEVFAVDKRVDARHAAQAAANGAQTDNSRPICRTSIGFPL